MSSPRIQDILCLLLGLAVTSVAMSLFTIWFGRPSELQLMLIGLPILLGTYWGSLWFWSLREEQDKSI